MPNKRTLQKKATKQKIFAAAVQLTKEHGFNQISIKQIVSTAHVSTGTFYLYFKSKQDIISQIYYENLNQTMQALLAELKTRPGSHPLHNLNQLLNAEFKFAANMGVEITTRAFIANLDANLQSPGNHFKQRTFTDGLRTELHEAILAKEISASDEDRLFLEIETMVRGMMLSWCFANGRFDIQATGTQLINDFFTNNQAN
ncbi:TetR/AcrR family transcriptional regulator [Fructilactobacillus cliffordii]|uniref:TetR/AcrR family transcriptional regulator n=1 Tax=Fructilactobacillus cliffordii TaxID=2940299 RepID=A0A9Q9E0Q8_9LACO|nr:TetR/AcrR family transcriptional regulator [Fructilactobacillus cliffordii]USS86356.1 TetR/AcrR family transcriptional regulator [Fructilactobacillus cliffordii]USS89421.1 TetR/AcrR family transcriptional regulator [Fructilactobacillus cliffordii]